MKIKRIKQKSKRIRLFNPSVPMNPKNLNWVQSKSRFPLMNPYGDLDRDGVKNFRDCKPFDIKRQGKEHDEEEEMAIGFEHIENLKTVGDIKLLEESILKRKKDYN